MHTTPQICTAIYVGCPWFTWEGRKSQRVACCVRPSGVCTSDELKKMKLRAKNVQVCPRCQREKDIGKKCWWCGLNVSSTS